MVIASPDNVAPTDRPDGLSSGRRWTAVAVAAAMLGLGMALVAQGFRGFSLLPEVTGEPAESAYGWVLALSGLAALLGWPLALAGLSGGLRWTGAGLAGLGIGVLVAVVAGVAGADRLSAVVTVAVGSAAVIALRWDRASRLVLRAVFMAGVLIAVMLTGSEIAVLGPLAALVSVGVADEVGSRVAR